MDRSFESAEDALDGLDFIGIKVLPAGDKVAGKYWFLETNAYFGTATSHDELSAFDRGALASSNDFSEGLVQFALKKNAFSVRCNR